MDIPQAIESIPDSWGLQYALMVLTLFILLLIAVIKAAYMKDLQNKELWFDSGHNERTNKFVSFIEFWFTTAISIMIAGLDPGVGSATWYVFDKGISHIDDQSVQLAIYWGLAVVLLTFMGWRVRVIKNQIRSQFAKDAKFYVRLHSMICPVQHRIHRRFLARRSATKTGTQVPAESETTPLKQKPIDCAETGHESGEVHHEANDKDDHWQLSR